MGGVCYKIITINGTRGRFKKGTRKMSYICYICVTLKLWKEKKQTKE